MILDVSDPSNPKEAGRWWMPGQKEGETKGEGPEGFHGPANVSPDGKMIAMGYAPAVVNLDISDIANPKLLGKLKFSPPFISVGGAIAAHRAAAMGPQPPVRRLRVARGALPRTARVRRAHRQPQSRAAKADLVVSAARAAQGRAYRNFCEKGGRFGPHNVNQEIHLPDVEKPGNLIYLTYFNAGLRVYNIKDPLLPVETGWFIPPDPPSNAGPCRATW